MPRGRTRRLGRAASALVMSLVLMPTLLVLSITGLPQVASASGSTTSVTITKYDAHGSVLSQTTVDYLWLEDNLLVQGDGTTH
ncbi:MAG: hypothetical protein NTU41_09220, partial [Chloroflexi bacterium]|nr:hypothetical protein [Chloroflexota bacterium]